MWHWLIDLLKVYVQQRTTELHFNDQSQSLDSQETAKTCDLCCIGLLLTSDDATELNCAWLIAWSRHSSTVRWLSCRERIYDNDTMLYPEWWKHIFCCTTDVPDLPVNCRTGFLVGFGALPDGWERLRAADSGGLQQQPPVRWRRLKSIYTSSTAVARLNEAIPNINWCAWYLPENSWLAFDYSCIPAELWRWSRERSGDPVRITVIKNHEIERKRKRDRER